MIAVIKSVNEVHNAECLHCRLRDATCSLAKLAQRRINKQLQEQINVKGREDNI